MSTIAIKLTNVSKRYTIHHEKPTLVERLTNGRDEQFWALKDINLTIKKGERVGIIGPNGSGKTTLLKIIAGITTPTDGTVETHGKIVSLIDLEAGFHPELTGEENIFLNGMLLGMTQSEIQKKLGRIIRFVDIKQFIDAPLFTYSNGMALRLGFSVAVHATPDILLLDENLSAGDTQFRKRAEHKIQQFYRQRKTVIVATHQLDFIRANCSRVIEIENGIIKNDRNQNAQAPLLSTYTESIQASLLTYTGKKNRIFYPLVSFLVALISVACSLLMIELFLRMTASAQYYVWPPHYQAIVKPYPNIAPGINGAARFLVNSIGARGEEIPKNATVRMLTIGGSTTEGALLDQDETWPALLQEKLNTMTSQRYWVGNIGKGGMNSRDYLLHMKYYVPQVSPPVNIVIILPGSNDVTMRLMDLKYTPLNLHDPSIEKTLMSHAFALYPDKVDLIESKLWSHMANTYQKNFRKSIFLPYGREDYIKFREKRKNANIILDTLPDLQPSLEEYIHNINDIIGYAKQKSLRLILLTHPYLWKQNQPKEEAALFWMGCTTKDNIYTCYTERALAEAMNAFNQSLLEVCRIQTIECIDLASQLPKDTTVFYDDIHINENGARLIADRIAVYLQSIMSGINKQ